tara:strand:- start:378 stop:587 length:210 start_codon:yes stop_codon:yes gene_type:complete
LEKIKKLVSVLIYRVVFITITLLFVVLITFALPSCSHQIDPDTATADYKVQQTIKQSWKWSRIKKLIFP